MVFFFFFFFLGVKALFCNVCVVLVGISGLKGTMDDQHKFGNCFGLVNFLPQKLEL